MEQAVAQVNAAVERSKAEKLGKGIVKILDSTVNMTVLAIFSLFMLYGCYALWDTNQIYRTADAQQYAMYRPAADGEESLSFGELQNINSDVFAWLTVYGTKIDYPVVQTNNNETYVNTNVMREYSLSGSLFLDYSNQNDYSDFNSIIYGHHMEKNAMFGEIASFMDSAYFSERLYGNLYYNGKNHGLELFAFLEVDAYDNTVFNPPIPAGHEQYYLDNIYTKALQSREIGVSEQDRIVLLSTCTATSTNGRHILIGRITDSTYANPFQEGAETQGTVVSKSIDTQSNFAVFQRLPWWVWGILGFLLLLIYMLEVIGRKKRKSAHGKIVNYKI